MFLKWDRKWLVFLGFSPKVSSSMKVGVEGNLISFPSHILGQHWCQNFVLYNSCHLETALFLINLLYFMKDFQSFSQSLILITAMHVDNGTMITLEHSLDRSLDTCRQSPLTFLTADNSIQQQVFKYCSPVVVLDSMAFAQKLSIYKPPVFISVAGFLPSLPPGYNS